MTKSFAEKSSPISYQYWQSISRKAQQRAFVFLAEPAALFSSYQAHWLQIYAALVSFFVLVGASLLLIQVGFLNSDIHHLIRYLYLPVIILAAYVLDQRIAIWLAIFCTGIYLPLLVQQLTKHGLTPHTIELCALLFSYNIIAVVTSTMTAFGRDHWRLSNMIEGFERVFKQAFDLTKVPLWILESGIHLTNARAGEIYLAQSDEMDPSSTLTSAELDSLARWALEQDQIINLSHIYQDPRLAIVQSYRSENGNLLIVPLATPAAQKGILVLWRETHQFRRREEELIQLLVSRGHLVVENARLHARTGDALAQRANELSILLDVSNTFATTLDLDKLLEILSNKLVQITGAAGCQIYLFDPDTSTLTRHLSKSSSQTNQDLRRQTFSAGDLPFHYEVLQKGASIVVYATETDQKVTVKEHALIFPQDRSVALFLPLIFQERTFGLAVLTHETRQNGFSPEKIRLGEAVGREAALALSNAWTYHSLQEAHQRIQLLIDNVAEGVFSIDTNRIITEFNPAAEELTGYSAACAKSLPVEKLIVCEEQRCPLCRKDLSLQDAVCSGEFDSPSHCKAWILRHDGERRPVSLSVSPLMSDEQHVSGAVSVVRDISKEEELVRMKSEFISLVSHQLRTPLTNISIAAEMLFNVQSPQEADLKLLQTLKQQSIRLRRLVDQVLLASRLERGQQHTTTALEPLVLRPLLEETLQIFRSQHPYILFLLSHPEDSVFVLGDRVLLEVTLENLIQNALDHAGDLSQIEVSVTIQDSTVLISVADDGDGIAETEKDRIFDPFHSGDDMGKKRRGFGLGLYLTRMAVETQGGQIWVEPNTGRGTRFCFTLNELLGD
ncbi:MAG: GAF domain-containing protein [Caldilineaceae bacterium]|nr:GAF domain-containing protein [Caldilineaceae bacterium]